MDEQFYQQVSESIKLVFNLTSRIDERVKILVEQHNDASQRIDKLMERQENIMTRISILENKNGNGVKEDMADLKKEMHLVEMKLSTLEIRSSGHDVKWKTAADFAFKIVLTIVGVVLAWRLGK